MSSGSDCGRFFHENLHHLALIGGKDNARALQVCVFETCEISSGFQQA
jgi:hypothetical protein